MFSIGLGNKGDVEKYIKDFIFKIFFMEEIKFIKERI